MKIKDIDHLTLTVSNIATTMRFYHEVFDLPIVNQTENELTIQVGHQKINFVVPTQAQAAGIATPTPGAGSISMIVKDPIEYVQNHLANYGVTVVKQPYEFHGSNGMMIAIDVYDPDQNLIQLCETKRRPANG